jgi:hypothetical protein
MFGDRFRSLVLTEARIANLPLMLRNVSESPWTRYFLSV